MMDNSDLGFQFQNAPGMGPITLLINRIQRSRQVEDDPFPCDVAFTILSIRSPPCLNAVGKSNARTGI
jgi:hypothetical protein